MRLSENICFQLAKSRVARRDAYVETPVAGNNTDEQAHAAGANPYAFDRDSYGEWRDESLTAQFQDHFRCEQLRGKRVLDFGCGTGGLSKLAADCGAASVDGLDIADEDVALARKRFGESSAPNAPQFHLTKNDRTLDFPDETFDVLLCFDVLEHIMHYREVIPDWFRVLTPEGRVLIWWQPYYHPWGHHQHSSIPIPWAHVFFSNETLAEVSYRVRQLPEYKPRYWDLDSEGNRINRPKADPETLGGVNRVGICRFESLFKESGLEIIRREAYPFSGPKLVKWISGLLSRLPYLADFFSAYIIYELRKPASGRHSEDALPKDSSWRHNAQAVPTN